MSKKLWIIAIALSILFGWLASQCEPRPTPFYPKEKYDAMSELIDEIRRIRHAEERENN